MLRVVLDTNVVISSQRGQNLAGPNREIIRRWQSGEFICLFTEDTVMEYAEKLIELDVPEDRIRRFLTALRVLGEKVEVRHFHLSVYPRDADDIAFMICAVNGRATHLVSYDRDLLDLKDNQEAEFMICQPTTFLAELRRSLAASP